MQSRIVRVPIWHIPNWLCSELGKSRSVYVPNWACDVPKWLCTELNMSRNGVYIPKWSCPETSGGHGAPWTEQWRLVTDSNERVGRKRISHFKVSNVNKVAIFYGIVLIPLVRMLFLFMYTFIILTMRLGAQCNSCPKWLKEARLAAKGEGNHVTFLNIDNFHLLLCCSLYIMYIIIYVHLCTYRCTWECWDKSYYLFVYR